jgi:hypothetical protein
MRVLRSIEFSLGLAVLTYLVLSAMLLWSKLYPWEYLRSNPQVFLGAAVPSGAVLVAGLVAYSVTWSVGSAPPRALMMAFIVPFIAFPLAAFVMSEGKAREMESVLSISGLFLLVPCMFVTGIYSTVYLSLRHRS